MAARKKTRSSSSSSPHRPHKSKAKPRARGLGAHKKRGAPHHVERLQRGSDWVQAQHTDGRMHVENSSGESWTMTMADWERQEEQLVKDGYHHVHPGHSGHHSPHHSPHHLPHVPPEHYKTHAVQSKRRPPKTPATEWDRLWHNYIQAAKSGSLREQVRTGRALLRFDRAHGMPSLPSTVQKLREAKALLAQHKEAFREAKALERELEHAERGLDHHSRRRRRRSVAAPRPRSRSSNPGPRLKRRKSLLAHF